MNNDEDLLADVAVDEVVEQRRLAATAQASLVTNAPGGGEMSSDLRAILGEAGRSAPPVASPSVTFGTDLSGINELGAAAVIRPSPQGGDFTPGGGGELAASTSQQMQHSAMAAALLASLQTPQPPQSPPTRTPATESGLLAAILRKHKEPYDALASQRAVMKEVTDMLPGGGDWKDFKNSILMDMGLTFFAKMDTGKATITVVHSIAHVTNKQLACYGMDVAFVGDRRGHRFPTAYTLPKEAPWQWRQIKVWNNLAELKAYSEREDVGRTLWKPGNDATTETKKIPRMIQIPSEWVVWLRESPRTGYEFAAEITRRIGLGTAENPSFTADEAKIWIDWGCAASQEGNKSGNSVLAFDLGAVVDDSDEWLEWCTRRIDSSLGAEQKPSADSQPAGSPTTTQDMLKLLTAHAMLGSQVQGTATTQQNGALVAQTAAQMNVHMMKGKKYNGNQIAKLMAWSGITHRAGIQPIWKKYQETTDLDTLREEIEARMLQWAERQGNGWDVDPAMFLVEQALDDWRNLRLAPSGATASWNNAERGASCLQCCPRTNDEQCLERERERDENDTRRMDTFEARQVRKKSKASDPRDPPDDYEELIKMITTFTGLVWVHFGDKCHMYQCLITIHEILKDKSVQARKSHYTSLICRTYTWAIIEDARYFFNQILMPQDFANAGPPKFPTSLLIHEVTKIHYAQPLCRSNFPAKWAFDGRMKRDNRTHSFHTAGFGGLPALGNGPPSPAAADPLAALRKELKEGIKMVQQSFANKNKTSNKGGGKQGENDNKKKRKLFGAEDLAHMHPRLLLFFRELHHLFNGVINFGELMELSGVKIGDMPTHPNYCTEDGKNGLCFNWIGGICPFDRCNQLSGHIAKEEVTDDMVNRIESLLKVGVEKMIQGERGTKWKKRRGK